MCKTRNEIQPFKGNPDFLEVPFFDYSMTFPLCILIAVCILLKPVMVKPVMVSDKYMLYPKYVDHKV